MSTTPRAQRIAHVHQVHGDQRPDDYYWLNDPANPEVIAYLEDENRYYRETIRPLERLTEELYQEMLSHVPDADDEVAVVDGPYYYYRRTPAHQQYPIYARKRAGNRQALTQAKEEVLLDLNHEAGAGSLYNVTVFRVSPDHSKLAYLENRDGTDRYTLRVKDQVSGSTLPDTVENVFLSESLEWDALGLTLYYTTVDDTQRPNRLMRHTLGQKNFLDACVFEENDPTFSLSLSKTRDARYLLLVSRNKQTSETRVLDLSAETGQFLVFTPRKEGILYEVEHWHDWFVVLTNDEAENFQVMACSDQTLPPSDLHAIFPYAPEWYLQELHPFLDALVISGRKNGLRQVWIYRGGSVPEMVEWSETLYTSTVGGNRSYDTPELLLNFESFVTPRTVFSLDLKTGVKTLLHTQEVPGGYDAALYEQKRLWVLANDGQTAIPVSIVGKKNPLRLGPAPLILYGYGSYGMSSDPHFDPAQLPLLDRGVILGTAHVRGGAEMGWAWYTDGKFRNKRHTFTDFIDVARYLIQEGYTTSDLMAARGRSAGGLLMGAVLNMAPELFQVVVPGVPFVDVMTTMMDESIPLTTLEWDEWGNPHDPGDYAYMKSYSPYDNVVAQDYPHIMIFTGLNDPRVGYWEPAKFVARLRDMKTDNHKLVLKTSMGAGHSGSSGRYARLHDYAEEYAFILSNLGSF